MRRNALDSLAWTAWVPLEGAGRNKAVPAGPGLYRIRRTDTPHLDYVGETGRSLRGPLGALARGVYANKMPYRDPHTAAPALWALRQEAGCTFEMAAATFTGASPLRKAVECALIALHRQEYGCSPTVNFGRMPRGFSPSSGNNKKLVAAGKRFRGHRTTKELDSHRASIAPVGRLDADSIGASWCGHSWSAWAPAAELERLVRPGDLGLYRVRDARGEILYLGEGAIRDRIRTHLASRGATGRGAAFAKPRELEASWMIGPWEKNQRLELECDLIAAYFLATGAPPEGQFKGSGRSPGDE